MEWIPTNHDYAFTNAPILFTCDISLPFIYVTYMYESCHTYECVLSHIWCVTYRCHLMSIVLKRFNCATSFVLLHVFYMCATSNNHFHCLHSWHIVRTLHQSSSRCSFVPPHSFHRASLTCATSNNHSNVIHVWHIVATLCQLFSNDSFMPPHSFYGTSHMCATNNNHPHVIYS